MARLVFAEKHKTKTKRPRHAKGAWRNVSLLLEPIHKNWWEDPDVVVAFNLPRISACLERLMGSNVVRLTDRKFMKELRDRIDADHRLQLQKRIAARELKEIERERILIIEGRTNVIPDELADDPIFVVNKIANIEIQKQRAKLKTSRERNSERLKLQGVKWERERLMHEDTERKHAEILRDRYKNQKELEEKYKGEDAERGTDLLRIHNEDWRDCEQELKAFLEAERAKMRERSERVSTPFATDPLDIQNIVRRKEKEKRGAEEKQLVRETTSRSSLTVSKISKYSKPSELSDAKLRLNSLESKSGFQEDEMAEYQKHRYSDDASGDLTTDDELDEVGSTISESVRRHQAELLEEIKEDTERGFIVSQEQYDHLRYTDQKLIDFRAATNVYDMYRLAEEIIIGDQYEDPVEEEVEEEEGLITADEVDIELESNVAK